MTVICSWCSTESPSGTVQCPTCGANLVPEADVDVPGVTAVDAASIIRSKSEQPSNPVLAWMNSEHSRAIAPPDDEVRREILRLELEAEVANLQAEADALRADAVVEGRTLERREAGATEEAETAATDSAEAATAATDSAEAATAATDSAEDSAEDAAAVDKPA